MKALHHVIIKSDHTYNNKVGSFSVNTSIDNVESINREATVVVAPKNTDLNPGDVVIVHHNIMRENMRIDKTKTRGNFYIGNNHYWCPVSEVLMKKDPNGSWDPLGNFLFVRPIKQENIELMGGLTLIPRSRKGMQELRAEVAIKNSKMLDIEVGDKVYMSNNSEHEFIIDGEVLFKCEIEDIIGVYE